MPASTDDMNNESATAIAMTLSKLTATDLFIISSTANVDPRVLLHGFGH